MPSVVVTGASRGLGYAFLTYYASQPNTTVIGIVRNREATEKRLAKDGVKNAHVVAADITDAKGVAKAADEVSKITGGSLDILYNNAGLVSKVSNYKTLVDFSPEVLEEDMMSSFRVNVIGVAHTINAFLPLIRKGSLKKVITISTGLADDELTNKYALPVSAPYSISKAGTNTLVAKYNAAFGQSEGILFLAISPGLVDTSEGKMPTEEQMQGMQAMGAKFASYAPNFTGPLQPLESVKYMVDVIDKATVETMGGGFVSHLGNKQWL